ncbi:MAG: ABC transporter permease, partial [Longimicrobiales bacterium]
MSSKPSRPPRLAEWLLTRVLPGSVAGRSILGDLREEFQRRVHAEEGSAGRWYWRESMSVFFTTLRDGEMPRSWAPPREVSEAFQSKGRGDGMMQQAWRDIRYAVRALARTPGFTAIAALTLALGIGANTAIFSVVNGVLLRPMPFEDPDQLVAVRSTAPGLGYDDFSLSPGIYVKYREAQVFEEIALLNRTSVNVTGDGDPERIDASFTSRTLFPTLGVSPLLGRNFTEEEDLPDGPQVVVIGHALWQSRFAGDRDVLGRTLQVNGVTRDIVGVMPEGFAFPSEDTQLWMPLAINPANASPGSFSFNSIGRLKRGAELD